MEHIDRVARSLYSTEIGIERELPKIRQLLSLFYTAQDDGTVVAVTREASWVVATFDREKLRISAEALISALASPANMVLRRLRTVKTDGRISDELTLGHDSIALALEYWNKADADRRVHRFARLRKGLLYYGGFSVFSSALLGLSRIFVTFDPFDILIYIWSLIVITFYIVMFYIMGMGSFRIAKVFFNVSRKEIHDLFAAVNLRGRR